MTSRCFTLRTDRSSTGRSVRAHERRVSRRAGLLGGQPQPLPSRLPRGCLQTVDFRSAPRRARRASGVPGSPARRFSFPRDPRPTRTGGLRSPTCSRMRTTRSCRRTVGSSFFGGVRENRNGHGHLRLHRRAEGPHRHDVGSDVGPRGAGLVTLAWPDSGADISLEGTPQLETTPVGAHSDSLRSVREKSQ